MAVDPQSTSGRSSVRIPQEAALYDPGGGILSCLGTANRRREMEVQHEAPHGDLNCSDQLQGPVRRKGPMGSGTAVVGFRPPGAPSTPWRTQPQWSASGPRPHKAPLGESNRSGRLQALRANFHMQGDAVMSYDSPQQTEALSYHWSHSSVG